MNEEIQKLIESTRYTSLNVSEAHSMRVLLENTEKEYDRMVNEGTLSGDVAQFTPILLPMVRRVYPNLIANELLGVQPMTMPTGYIYALTNRYTGTDLNKVSPTASGIVVEYTFTANDSDDANIKAGDVVTGNASSAVGTVTFVDGEGKALIAVTSGSFTLSDNAATVNTPEDGDTDGATIAISGVYSNEASFGLILKGYTGPYTTAEAEKLGKDMREVGFSIDKKSIEVKSRALKGQYSVEMLQDLKRQHGLAADEEVMSLMAYEMQAELDREIVDFVNANSTQVANAYNFTAASDAEGRWEIEKYRVQAIKLSAEAKQIGLDTKRGQGNTLVVSPKVITMLEQIGSFATAPMSNGTTNPISGGVAGTFDNQFKVIVDQYATSDYATVLYKGANNRDAMGFFAPYVPISFTKVTHAESGQPAVIAKTRYGLDTIPGISSASSNDRAKLYSRSFGIDFTNTVLA
jgi:hypothetical protein